MSVGPAALTLSWRGACLAVRTRGERLCGFPTCFTRAGSNGHFLTAQLPIPVTRQLLDPCNMPFPALLLERMPQSQDTAGRDGRQHKAGVTTLTCPLLSQGAGRFPGDRSLPEGMGAPHPPWFLFSLRLCWEQIFALSGARHFPRLVITQPMPCRASSLKAGAVPVLPCVQLGAGGCSASGVTAGQPVVCLALLYS